jgi:hypothetical protein
VARPVVFFVLSSALVLANDVVVVFIERAAGHEASLHVRPHSQPVEIKPGLVFDNQGCLNDETIKIDSSLLVDSTRMRIGTGWKFDFWSRDTKEAQRVSVGELASFFSAHDVIWNS